MYSEKYTLSKCRESILKLLERYSSNGYENTCGEVRDIENRLVTSLNVHLNKLWYEFSDTRKKIGIDVRGYDIAFDYGSMKLSDGSIFTKYFGGKKPAFHITARGKGQLVFFTEIVSSRYIINTSRGEWVNLCGIIDNSTQADCHFLLTAEPSLEVKSFVIYDGVEEQDAELVCGPSEIAVYLPQACSRIMSLCRADGKALSTECYSIDEEKCLIVFPRKLSGEYIMEYIPYPPSFKDDASDSDAVLLSPIMFDALCYMCAADLCPAGEGELYTKLTYRYREILENIYDRHRSYKIRNSFFGVAGSKLKGSFVKLVK